jgi:hypothetical protein
LSFVRRIVVAKMPLRSDEHIDLSMSPAILAVDIVVFVLLLNKWWRDEPP